MTTKQLLLANQVLSLLVIPKSIRIRPLVTAGLVCFAASQAALAQAIPPIACDNSVYLSQGSSTTTLKRRAESNIAGDFLEVGSGTPGYNAMGISPDGYLYGLAVGTADLVQINPANGSVTPLGAVLGLADPGAANYNAGAFDTDGNFYVKVAGDNTSLYVIDVLAKSAMPIPLALGFTTSDLAWIAGKLYAVSSEGQLMSINVTTGDVTLIGSPVTPSPGVRVFGALFGFSDGLFGAANEGGYYQIDLVTGVQTQISQAPASLQNDGANCPRAAFTPTPIPTPVPTLGEWGLTLLAGLMGLIGLTSVRKRRTR